MKSFATLLIACVLFQTTQAQQLKTRHSFQVQTGFAYASDLGYEEEMKRSFQGLGYQYTTKNNWYFGTEVQYHRNQLNSSRLMPLQLRSDNNTYSLRMPGAMNDMGYFTLPAALQSSASVITNANVFKTQPNQLPTPTQSLQASRLNIMFHSGKRWQAGKGIIEAGVTLTGTFYNRDVILSKTQQQTIALRSLTTGEAFNSIVEVTTLGIENEQTFWAGAGFHARYQYPVSKNISLGVQLLSSMSVEGIVLQAAPRMVIGF